MPKQILKDALLLPAALQINYPKLSLSFELFSFFPFCSACIFISFRFALSYKAWTAFIAMSYKSFYQGVISYERTTTITKTERCSFYDKCRKEKPRQVEHVLLIIWGAVEEERAARAAPLKAIPSGESKCHEHEHPKKKSDQEIVRNWFKTAPQVPK